MRTNDIIPEKRNGGTLTKEEIAFFIDGIIDDSVPDYQASASSIPFYISSRTFSV